MFPEITIHIGITTRSGFYDFPQNCLVVIQIANSLGISQQQQKRRVYALASTVYGMYIVQDRVTV